jgi:hypothetical protein
MPAPRRSLWRATYLQLPYHPAGHDRPFNMRYEENVLRYPLEQDAGLRWEDPTNERKRRNFDGVAH